MCLENDTSHEIFADNFIRNRGENFMKLLRKSGGSHFFDSLKRDGPDGPSRFIHMFDFIQAFSDTKFWRICATSARVAVSAGISFPLLPCTTPVPQAHCMAGAA